MNFNTCHIPFQYHEWGWLQLGDTQEKKYHMSSTQFRTSKKPIYVPISTNIYQIFGTSYIQ